MAVFLACPPSINNAEGQQILANVREWFTYLCPPALRVLQVRPLLGKYKKFKCAWFVEYGNNKDLQVATNKKVKSKLEDNKPHGTQILLRKREPFSGTWFIHYGIENCICPPRLTVKNEDYEIK